MLAEQFCSRPLGWLLVFQGYGLTCPAVGAGCPCASRDHGVTGLHVSCDASGSWPSFQSGRGFPAGGEGEPSAQALPSIRSHHIPFAHVPSARASPTHKPRFKGTKKDLHILREIRGRRATKTHCKEAFTPGWAYGGPAPTHPQAIQLIEKGTERQDRSRKKATWSVRPDMSGFFVCFLS